MEPTTIFLPNYSEKKNINNLHDLRNKDISWENLLVRRNAGLRVIRECKSNYRVIKPELLSQINLDKSIVIDLSSLKPLFYFLITFVFSIVLTFIIISAATAGLISFQTILPIFITVFSGVLTLQGIFTLVWMLYAWENPENVDRHKSPKEFYPPPLLFYCPYTS